MTATLLDHWKAYRKQAMPKDAGPNQVEDTRNAFYGGAAMVIMTLQMIEKPNISEAQGVRILAGMEKEIADFMKKHAMKHGL